MSETQIPANRDLIIISRGIDRVLHYDLSRVIQKQKHHENCTVFLTTRGGDPDGGYRIGRCLRHHYKHIRLVVPSFCKSAGTLVAIAANELAIGDLGELGPLDVQVRKQNEMLENNSGLDFNQSMQAALEHVMRAFRLALLDIRHGTRISTRLAGEFATKIASSVATPLYSQIDPNRVGEMQRAILIAIEYGNRLNDLSSALTDSDSLRKLVADYPSHSFVIDRKEAATLFKNVSHPTNDEISIYEKLWDHLQDESGFGPVVIPGETKNDSQEHATSNISKNDDSTQPNTIEADPSKGNQHSSGQCDKSCKTSE